MGSAEESDISESEINHYKQNPYRHLRAGKYKIKNPNGTFKSHFCPGKRKEEYHYGELQQRASGVAQCHEKSTSLSRMLEENDKMYLAYNEGFDEAVKWLHDYWNQENGDLSLRPFQQERKRRYLNRTAMEKAALLCSKWQEYIQDPGCHPFKILETEGKGNEAYEGNKLRTLREKWGKDVYRVVATALKEMNDYNPSGRYIVPELWNFKKERKAALKAVIA
ncbi:hypothetical protein RJ640_009436 [Escallonia rubra]|uniref:Factor of DNA methylation 1-5/IDN2 domain-containing protein n=1 Tax=Escallonia rubra TaxID=112253 RepID=A0AA88UES2_9ASTE|nr:hypothetical protein RJ640_009436 [Escallonia rubra]